MKNLFVYLLIFSILLPFNSNAQDTNNVDDDFLQDYEEKITLGNLKLKIVYLSIDDKSPKEGYLLSIEDLAEVKYVMDDHENDCNSWIDKAKIICKKELNDCNERAESRVMLCHNVRDNALKENNSLKLSLEQQKNKTVYWAIGGTLLGVSAGIIATLILK